MSEMFIGVDVGKTSHYAIALDADGAEIDRRSVANTQTDFPISTHQPLAGATSPALECLVHTGAPHRSVETHGMVSPRRAADQIHAGDPSS